jgi:hypothetical protein
MTSSAIGFFLAMNKEAKTVRPMTVSPPVVIFGCTPRNLEYSEINQTFSGMMW